MITVATAECFTHGLIAREIHALSQGYEEEFGCHYLSDIQQASLSSGEYYPDSSADDTFPDVSVVCSIFAPTLSSLKNNLKIEDVPQPYKVIKGVKIYDEKQDKEVAVLMAQAVREISKADIGIGTCAGVGKGGIALSTPNFTIVSTSGFYADLTYPCSSQLLKRQENGVKKALDIFLAVLNGDLEDVLNYEDVSLR